MMDGDPKLGEGWKRNLKLVGLNAVISCVER